MKPRINLITLGVADLERAYKFYSEGLGFPSQGIIGTEFEYGAVAFFDLQNGLMLAVWPRTSMSRDTGLPQGTPDPTDFSLGHNVASREEVDAVMSQALKAGATLVKPAQNAFWGGYSGYFRDPDGHLWEVAWSEQFLPQD